MKVDFWISLSHRRLPLKWQTHENTKAAFLKTYWNKHTHSHKHACSHSGNFVLFESKRTVCCLQNKQVHDPHNSIWILSENAWITAYLCMFLFSYSSQFSFYKSGPFCQVLFTFSEGHSSRNDYNFFFYKFTYILHILCSIFLFLIEQKYFCS